MLTPDKWKTCVILIFILILCACGTTAHVGVYHDFAGDPEMKGQNPAALMWIEKRVNDRLACQYFHFSHYSSGWPVNENAESIADMIGCDVRVW